LEGAPKDLAAFESPAGDRQAAETRLEVFEGESGIEEGAEKHITAGARERLYIEASGHARQYTIVNRSGGVQAAPFRAPPALGGQAAVRRR